jgi:hypothetical protein
VPFLKRGFSKAGFVMAIFHLSAKTVSRGKGQSAIAKAAYNSRDKIRDERTGEMKDYSRGEGVVFSGIFAPKDAPAWARDRATLWNEVERTEKRKDAQLAREITLGLPHELAAEQRRQLVTDFVREQFVRQGMIADVVIHSPSGKGDDRNHHAHVLLTMREIGPDGFGPKVRDWNSREQIEKWREGWERTQNRYLERHGHDARVDRRTLEAQGIDREPTTHLGPHASAMERQKGVETERGKIHRESHTAEQEAAKLKRELAAVERQISALEHGTTVTRPPRETRAGKRGQEQREDRSQNPASTGERRGMTGATAWIHGLLTDLMNHPERGKTFSAVLEKKGIAFARVTKEEANRSDPENAFAREIGNFAPRYREGEIVAVTEPRLEHRREGEIMEPRRVLKLDQDAAAKFVAALDKGIRLQGIDATKRMLDARAHDRAERWNAIRFDHATNKGNRRSTRNALRQADAIIDRGIGTAGKFVAKTGKGMGAATKVVEKTFHAAADAFASLFSPPTPRTAEQIEQDRKHETNATHDAPSAWQRYARTDDYERHEASQREAAQQRQRESDHWRKRQERERER